MTEQTFGVPPVLKGRERVTVHGLADLTGKHVNDVRFLLSFLGVPVNASDIVLVSDLISAENRRQRTDG